MNGKFISVKFSEFDFLRWQLQNWKKKNSVKVTDIYLKQNTVFQFIDLHGLILYKASKSKNQEANNYERKPKPHYSENATFSHDWKPAFPTFSLQNKQFYCILIALHFQKRLYVHFSKQYK